MADRSNKITISLKRLTFQEGNEFYSVCLDVNIVVSGKSLDEVKEKMGNALISYFNSFTIDELRNHKYIRKAPLSYYFKYHIAVPLYRFTRLLKPSYNLEYDPKSKDLKFA